MAAFGLPSFFMGRRNWVTFEYCADEAMKYQTRKAFEQGSRGAYQWLHKHGRIDDACGHMSTSPNYSSVRWTHESVFAEAAKYKNRAEFKRKCSGAHGYALANNIMEPACAHMRGHNFWHMLELMAAAIKYRHKPDFIRNEPAAYNFINRQPGLIDQVCAHMTSHTRTWNKLEAMEVAARCRSRSELQALYAGAYKHADKHCYLDEACAHMPPPNFGFSQEKAAVLYHLRIALPDGLCIYKIGITNRSPEARIASLGLFPGVKAEVLTTITFESGRDARIAEKRLHRRHSSNKYRGPKVMMNGNTELFVTGVLEP